VNIETIPSLLSRHPEFPAWVDQIRALGTDNLEWFGNGYTHEGGLSLQQNPDELAALALFLKDQSLDRWMHSVYLEIGSASGGTGWYLYEKFRFKRFLSIDNGQHPRAVEQMNHFSKIPGIRLYRDDSHIPAAAKFLKAHCHADGPIGLAFIDGDHSLEGLYQDIELVKPFMAPGGMIVLHDIVACEGVNRAWEQCCTTGGFAPLAEFVGEEKPLGIGVAQVTNGQ
jgi:cephalosporin hydroxylase